MNAEHLQLLIFLFHSLPLMQKKTLLLLVGQTVISVAQTLEAASPYSHLMDTVPLPISRIMLILDYLLHYFYDPPVALMDQVRPLPNPKLQVVMLSSSKILV